MIHDIAENQLTSEVNKQSSVVIVEFSFPQSIPCEQQHQVLREIDLAFSETTTIFRISLSELSQELKIRYDIRSLPTLLFFKDGEEKERKIGFTDFSLITEILQELSS